MSDPGENLERSVANGLILGYLKCYEWQFTFKTFRRPAQ